MKIAFTAALIAFCLVWQGCKKELSATGQAPAFLEITFNHTIQALPLQLNTGYTNSFGEDFLISKLKYYVSNISLYNGGNSRVLPDTYFLVDEGVAASKTIRIPVPPGTYQHLDLLLGVDSTRNVSGAQTGALDPVNDMFWTWNTGYIMMKLEGSSNVSTAPNNRIQYHIGGFSGPYSALRTLEADFSDAVTLNAGQTLLVRFSADVLRWFDGVHPLPIKEAAVSMSPDERSARFADNVASMMQITSVSVQ